MALNNGALLNVGFETLATSETARMVAMGALTTMVLNCTALAVGKPMDDKSIRQIIAAEAATLDVPKSTYEAYINGIFECAAKMALNLPERVAALGDMGEVEAVSDVVTIYAEYGVTSGGHIRAWGKQEGFEVYDADLVAKQRKQAQADKAKAAMTAVLASFKATSGRDSSTVTVEAKSDLAPMTAIETILAAISTLNDADVVAAMVALNARSAELAGMVASLPAETIAPVLADDVDTTANKRRRSVKGLASIGEAVAA